MPVCGAAYASRQFLLCCGSLYRHLFCRGRHIIDLVSICTALQARLDLGPLARALNRIDHGRQAGMEWSASSLVDTGPILR